MGERKDLLAALRARLDRATATGDYAAVLGPDAVADGRRLAGTWGDLETLHAVGWLHWLRHQGAPGGADDGEDREIAARALTRCFVEGVTHLPGELLPELARRALPAVAAQVAMVGLGAADHGLVFATVCLLQRILAVTPVGDPGLPLYLNDLAMMTLAWFERTGDQADLDQALETVRAAVDAAPAGHPALALLLYNAGTILYAHATATGEAADVDQAIEAFAAAIDASSADDPNRVAYLYNSSATLHIRAQRTGRRADLDKAIETGESALARAPDGHPLRPAIRTNIGAARLARFELAGERADLDAAVEIARAVAVGVPDDDPQRPRYLFHLGNARQLLYARTGDAGDLDAAIEAQRTALEMIPAGHPDLPPLLAALATSLYMRFTRSGAGADLDEAIDFGRAAADSQPPGNRSRAHMLANLANAYVARFTLTGQLGDLDAAIDASRTAVDIAPDGDGTRAKYLSALGAAMAARFGRSGELADLGAAIDAHSAAVQAREPNDAERGATMANFATVLRARFENTADPADLDVAVESGRAAVELLPVGHHLRPLALSSLAIALELRSEESGELADLDAAIDTAQAAVEATPPGHADLAMHLHSLGSALNARFQWTGGLADQEAAIEVLRAAADADPAGHVHRALDLSFLSTALLVRYRRTRAAADLDAAVEAGRASVDASPAGRDAGALATLGRALCLRFEQTRSIAELDEGVAALRTAVADMADADPKRAVALSTLADALAARFDGAGDRRDLDEAIELARAIVAADLPGRPRRAYHLATLGKALLQRFRLTGAADDYSAALAAITEAADTESAIPSFRLQMAGTGAGLAAPGGIPALGARPPGSPALAARLAELAVRTLPTVTPVRLARSDRQFALREIAGVASDAAALALNDTSAMSGDERAARALRLLEGGRAVLLSQALDARTDLTDLTERHPGLARRFRELRDFLDQPDGDAITALPPRGGGPAAGDRPDRAASSRARLADEFAVLQERIRELDGFASFGLPPSAAELRAEAHAGPIVAFSTSTVRCDALVVTTDRITDVELPGLTMDALTGNVRAFHEALAVMADPESAVKSRAAAQESMRGVLAWLWNTAAGPVLAALGYDRVPAAGDPWPRVWWAPGGLLGLLPIHAAGYHGDDVGEHAGAAVMDRVISSYTPTIRALRYSRQRARATAGPDSRSLIVAMATTPGLPNGDLPGVPAEVSRIRGLLPGPVLLSESSPGQDADSRPSLVPTKASVLRALPGCAIAHFACHGATDPVDPSRSMLLLHDHASDPLTVASLAPVDLASARLAYLSACRTASVSANGLIDEALQLATAFQLAGFPSVVGTLWEIPDRTAIAIAEAFYRALRDGQGVLVASDAARALHDAVRAQRDASPGMPFLWAAYLHLGA